MGIRSILMLGLLVSACCGCVHLLWGCEYRDSLDARIVDAEGALRVQIDAGAGALRVEGRRSLTEVRVYGECCADRKELLSGFDVAADRTGEVVRIRTLLPVDDHEAASLDLVIEVPETMHVIVWDTTGPIGVDDVASLEVQDGLGEIVVDGVAGDVQIQDGTGDIEVCDVSGNVWITDGEGDVEIEDVRGSVFVTEDGPGGIDVSGVTGSVIVQRDGSGEIRVSDVGGDFTVERDEGGGIEHEDVGGEVSLPGEP